MLYKEGPHAYHASFVVILDILDENLQRKEKNFRRSMDYSKILGLNRLCETTGKVYFNINLSSYKKQQTFNLYF